MHRDGRETELRAGALKFPSILMQGITHIGPAASVILLLHILAEKAGAVVPLAFAICFAIILSLGVSLAQLAKHLPSAGGYYTYVSRTVHPRAGFLTAWLYFLYDPACSAANFSYMGYLTQQVLWSHWGIHFPWWLFLVVAALAILALAYRGIEVSTGMMAILGVSEIVILVALSVTGIASPGEGGVNLASFNPANAPSLSGLSLAVVLTILCFSGFESVAPLAEESENPKRNLPRAILGSILCIGVFYVFCAWGLLVGWGTDALSSFVASSSEESPVFILARRLWGSGWLLVFLALLNSVLAISIACTNAATRVFFAMGRGGALPSWFGKVHPTYQTPTNAILFQTVLTLVLGLGLGFSIGPEQEFMIISVMTGLGLVFVYTAGNLGVFLFFRGEHRREFNPLLHAVLPLASSIAMVLAGVFSVTTTEEGAIERFAPYLVGAWLVLGILLLFAMRLAGREGWLLKAGQIAYDRGEPPPGSAGADQT